MHELDMRRWREEGALAFNAGAQARISGRAPGANPFPKIDPLHYKWGQGWLDADRNWGSEAKWDVTPLPEVPPCPSDAGRRSTP